MNKNLVIAIVALVIVVACGVAEVVWINDGYGKLAEKCDSLIQMCDDLTLTVEIYGEFADEWYELRETSELLLPHNDVYELNLRVSEAESYVAKGDFDSARAQLVVASQLLRYVPHLIVPNFKHVF